MHCRSERRDNSIQFNSAFPSLSIVQFKSSLSPELNWTIESTDFIKTVRLTSRGPSSLSKSEKRCAVPLYDQSWAPYGIILRTGYFEMIPRNILLPAHASEIFETITDNIDRDTFKIATMASPLDTPRTIAEIELRGILIARKGIPNIMMNFSINKDQVGRVTIQDTKTLSAASVTFIAGIFNAGLLRLMKRFIF